LELDDDEEDEDAGWDVGAEAGTGARVGAGAGAEAEEDPPVAYLDPMAAATALARAAAAATSAVLMAEAPGAALAAAGLDAVECDDLWPLGACTASSANKSASSADKDEGRADDFNSKRRGPAPAVSLAEGLIMERSPRRYWFHNLATD
jgi:hypothetical protein